MLFRSRSLGSHDYFELRAAKRGKRLRWTAEDFATPVFTKIIAHSTTGICWREASKEEFQAACGSDDQSSSRFKRYKPGLDEFVAIFPTTVNGDPRRGLLSADQIKNTFHERGWHKDFYRGLCDEAEAAGKIVAARGEGRGGQILRGLPAMTAAFEKHRAEAGSIMEEVPLKVHGKPSRRRKSRPD